MKEGGGRSPVSRHLTVSFLNHTFVSYALDSLQSI